MIPTHVPVCQGLNLDHILLTDTLVCLQREKKPVLNTIKNLKRGDEVVIHFTNQSVSETLKMVRRIKNGIIVYQVYDIITESVRTGTVDTKFITLKN